MVRPDLKEQAVRLLARLIDPDEPPGLAANELARAVVTLVQDRGGRTAAVMLRAIAKLEEEFSRPEFRDLDSDEDVDQ